MDTGRPPTNALARDRLKNYFCASTVVLCLMVFLGASGADASGGSAAGSRAHAMSLTQAVILGITEGVTEYLPVSSTGHLYLASRLMGLGRTPREIEAVNAYVIAVQIGAILAVFWLYPHRVRSMLRGLAGRDRQGMSLALCALAALLPAAAAGLVLGEAIKARLFRVWPITWALLAGGIAILAVAKRLRHGTGGGKRIEDLGLTGALIIGFAQCIALWPGVSRSLVTILAGVITGLTVRAAVEFSFILGLVTLGAATVYEIAREGPAMILQFGWQAPLVGIVVAFASAVAAVRWMVSYLNRHGLEVFGYYRIALGIACMGLALMGVL